MRRRTALVLLVAALAAQAQPILAQSFFERLFRLPPPQYVPQPQPQLQIRPPQRRPAPQQRAAPQPSKAPAPEPDVPEPPPQPYEKDLLRLAEIIGALAFLRTLCTMPDATEWPKRMQELLDAEGTTPGRRERLAGAYNKGYRAYSMTYRVCTSSATAATDRYFAEGDQLAQTLAGRYGG